MNKNIIQIAVLFCVFSFLTTSLKAQVNNHLSKDSLVAREVRYFTYRLKLDNAQGEQIALATRRHHADLDSLNKINLGPVERTQALKQLMNNYHLGIKKALTETQFREYNELMEKRKTAFKREIEKKEKITSEIN